MECVVLRRDSRDAAAPKDVIVAALAILRLSHRMRQRCQRCATCRAHDCGACVNCVDKVKFGGRGGRKQGCKLRPPCVGYPRRVVYATRPYDDVAPAELDVG